MGVCEGSIGGTVVYNESYRGYYPHLGRCREIDRGGESPPSDPVGGRSHLRPHLAEERSGRGELYYYSMVAVVGNTGVKIFCIK